MMWTLDSAIEFVRQLERHLSPSWHVALAGGVLMCGESQHDLDVVVFPHAAGGPIRLGALRDFLQRFGLRLRMDYVAMREHWRIKGSSDEKTVEVWSTADGRRIDMLVLQ